MPRQARSYRAPSRWLGAAFGASFVACSALSTFDFDGYHAGSLSDATAGAPYDDAPPTPALDAAPPLDAPKAVSDSATLADTLPVGSGLDGQSLESSVPDARDAAEAGGQEGADACPPSGGSGCQGFGCPCGGDPDEGAPCNNGQTCPSGFACCATGSGNTALTCVPSSNGSCS